jgi:hypothetical protein
VHYTCAEAGKFQHFIVRDAFNLASPFDHTRVRGKDSFDVCVDLTQFCIQYGRQSRCSCIAAAAAQSRDIHLGIDALKASGDDNVADFEQLLHALGGDADDSSFGVRGVGEHTNLSAGETDRFFAKFMDGHRHKRHRFLFARRQQHVHLAWSRLAGDFFGKIDKFVGLVPSRAHDDDDVVSFAFRFHRATGCAADFFGIGHTRATKLLHNDCHVVVFSCGKDLP